MKIEFWRKAGDTARLLVVVSEQDAGVIEDAISLAEAELSGKHLAKPVHVVAIDEECYRKFANQAGVLEVGRVFDSALLASRYIGLPTNQVAMALAKARRQGPRDDDDRNGPWPRATVRGVTFQYLEDMTGVG